MDKHVLSPCPLSTHGVPCAQVNTHGSGNVYAFFMRNGSALVEILPWNMLRPCISEPYADVYFK